MEAAQIQNFTDQSKFNLSSVYFFLNSSMLAKVFIFSARYPPNNTYNLDDHSIWNSHNKEMRVYKSVASSEKIFWPAGFCTEGRW